ncbi:hypothetical protein GCM10009122_13380 [Fulvivirga kasyanovii]|nr:energy transducer TonB [Fulvivirga kasyanovii]
MRNNSFFLVFTIITILLSGLKAHAQNGQSIITKERNLFIDSITLLLFDKEPIRPNHAFGIGEELYLNLHNVRGLTVKDDQSHFGIKIDISTALDEKSKVTFEHYANDFQFTPDSESIILYFPLIFDNKFSPGVNYSAQVHCYDYNDPKRSIDIRFDFTIDPKFSLKKLETTSNELGLTYVSSYFSLDPALPSHTNVFQYNEEGPYKVYYFLNEIDDATKPTNATANLFLVYYGDHNQFTGNYLVFKLGSDIRIEGEHFDVNASFKVGNTRYRAIGKGSYAIVTIITDNVGSNKLVTVDNFYVVDQDSVENNIDFTDIYDKKHIDLPDNGEAELFGNPPGEFKRYLKFHLANLIEDTEYITNEKIKVGFTVDPTGQITRVNVVDCKDEWLKEQIIKIAEGCPKWRPQTVNGQAVSSNYLISTTLNLSFD